MHQNSDILIKILIDTIIFLEFSDESVINQDSAIAMMEQISSDLRKMNIDDKQKLLGVIEAILDYYPENHKEFLRNLSKDFFGDIK